MQDRYDSPSGCYMYGGFLYWNKGEFDNTTTKNFADRCSEKKSCVCNKVPEVHGCTDHTASNFNINANIDDGTCTHCNADNDDTGCMDGYTCKAGRSSSYSTSYTFDLSARDDAVDTSVTCDAQGLCPKTCSGIAYSWVVKGHNTNSEHNSFKLVGDTVTELDKGQNNNIHCISETSGKLTLETALDKWEGELQLQFLEVYVTEFVMAVEGAADDRNRKLFFKNKEGVWQKRREGLDWRDMFCTDGKCTMSVKIDDQDFMSNAERQAFTLIKFDLNRAENHCDRGVCGRGLKYEPDCSICAGANDKNYFMTDGLITRCKPCDYLTYMPNSSHLSPTCVPKTNTTCDSDGCVGGSVCGVGSGLDYALTDRENDSKCVQCDPATHFSDKTDSSVCQAKALSPCTAGQKYTLGGDDVDSKCEECNPGYTYMDESNHKIDSCKSSLNSCANGFGLYRSMDKTEDKNLCLPCDRSFEHICDILMAKGRITTKADCNYYLQTELDLENNFNTLQKYNNRTDHAMCLAHGDVQCDPGYGRVDGDQDLLLHAQHVNMGRIERAIQNFHSGGVNVKCQVKKVLVLKILHCTFSNIVTEDNKCVCENDAFHPYGNTDVCVRMTVCASDEIEVVASQLLNSSKPWAIDNGYKSDRQCAKKCTVTAPQNGAMGDCASVIATGTSCHPTCNEGYEVSGKSTCLDTGLDAAVCTEKPCDISFLTSLLSNGDAGTCANRNSLSHGESCVSTCDDGYVEIGSGSCDKGSFKIDGNVITSDSPDICVPKSCVLPDLPNGDKCTNKTELNHGETCVPTCDDGYKLVGHESKQYSCSLGNLNHLECKRCPDGSYDSDKNHLTECQTKEKNCTSGKGLYKGNSFVEDDWVCKPCDNQTHGTLNQFNDKEDDKPCVAHKTYNDPTLSPDDHAEPCNAKPGYHFVDGDSENDARCEPCGKGKVSAAHQSDCTTCLPGTEQVVDAFDGDVCPVCPVGKYDHDNNPSTACQLKTQTCVKGEGLYKNTSKVANDWICKPCDNETQGTLNQFNDKEDDQPCVAHKTYNDPTLSPDEHADPCNARPGYHLVEGDSEKDAKCEPCAEKTFSKANESVCTPCPPNHIAPSASGSCTPCEPNETEENNVCICKLPSVLKNGVCEEQRLGCINPNATKSDSHKNTDDGSCYRHCVGSWSDCINSTQTYIKTVLKLGLGDECAEHNAQEECIAALGTDSANVDVLSFDNLREAINENNKNAKINGKSLLRQVVEKKFDLKTVQLFTNKKADVSEALRFLKDNVKTDTVGADRPDKIEALKVMMPKKVEYTKSFNVSGTQQDKINEIKRIVAERYDTVVELVQITLKGRRRLLSTYRRKLLSVDVDIVVQTDVSCQGDDSCNVVCDGFTEDGECKTLTECLPGEYEVEAPTATSDRVCASNCPENIFSSNEAEHLADYTVVRLCDLCVDNYHTQAGSDTCHPCPTVY